MIVIKFGGTSVGSVEAIHSAVEIITQRREQQPVVVASAMGKTTSALLEIGRTAALGDKEEALTIFSQLREYHLDTSARILNVNRLEEVRGRLSGYFEKIGEILQGLFLLGENSLRSRDLIASFGERMSTLLLAEALIEQGAAAQLMDARRMVWTDENHTRASVIEDRTLQAMRAQILPFLQDGKIPVVQGFIGSTTAGVTTTIGRGGSDYTASLIGAAIGASDIQIWTDVPGILTADPRIVPEALQINRISFVEASELAYFGAKVLYPATLLPAMRCNIPVHVCSTWRMSDPGTLISAEAVPSTVAVKSIACKPGITIVSVYSTRMLMAHGFLRRIFEVFDRYETVVDVVSTSEVSVSLSVDSAARLDSIIRDLESFAEVEVQSGLAIICAVGDSLKKSAGTTSRIFRSLETTNIHMISVGASRINVTFIVDEAEMPETVRRLHREFFSDPDPGLFRQVN